MTEHDLSPEPSVTPPSEGEPPDASAPEIVSEPAPEPTADADDGEAAERTDATEPTPVPDAADGTGSTTPRVLRGDASRQRLKLIGSGLAALIIVAVIGFMAYQTFTERLQAVRNIDAATALIEQADVIVVQVDTVVRSEVTSTLAEPARAAAAQVPDATSSLDQAITLLEQSSQGTTLDDEKRAVQLLAAAKARRDMMEQAPEILRLNQVASEALGPARAGWDALIAADQKSDAAVTAYNRLTKAGVRESRRLNREVAGELGLARERLAAAEQLFPEAPFDQYLAYLDIRIALNRLSQQSDAAWLDGDVKRANSIIMRYNTQDASAIARAKALPETPEKAIADAYETAARQATDAYYQARDAATDADRQLRE